MHTRLESVLPLSQDPADNRQTYSHQVRHAGPQPARVGLVEVLVRRHVGRRAVEAGARAHDDDAAEVDEARCGAAQERLERGAVFPVGGAVLALAGGDERGVLFEGGAGDGTGVEDVAGGAVAGDEGGGLVRGAVGVVFAEGGGGGGVVEFGVFGEVHELWGSLVGDRAGNMEGWERADSEAKTFVELEDFGAVYVL